MFFLLYNIKAVELNFKAGTLYVSSVESFKLTSLKRNKMILVSSLKMLLQVYTSIYKQGIYSPSQRSDVNND